MGDSEEDRRGPLLRWLPGFSHVPSLVSKGLRATSVSGWVLGQRVARCGGLCPSWAWARAAHSHSLRPRPGGCQLVSQRLLASEACLHPLRPQPRCPPARPFPTAWPWSTVHSSPPASRPTQTDDPARPRPLPAPPLSAIIYHLVPFKDGG